MSKVSRRSLVTSGAAALPALALPAVAATGGDPNWLLSNQLPAIGDASPAAAVARAEYLVEIFNTCYVCPGWQQAFDRERAGRFIENVRRSYDDDACWQEAIDWIMEHGQSLDWLVSGDTGSMICKGAKRRRVATAIPDPIFAAIEAHERAYAEHGVALDAQDEAADEGNIDRIQKAEERAGLACSAQVELARKLCSTMPTTIAGLAAVLKYVMVTEARGDNILLIYANDDADAEWYSRDSCELSFLRTLSEAAERLVTAQA